MSTSDRADPHVVAAGHAPTPFTAAEIRAGCPPGRTTRLVVETTGAAPRVRVTRYVECTDDAAVQERWEEGPDGERTGTVERLRVTWTELQAHASFPADRTTIGEDALETPLGLLPCLRYTVEDGSGVDTFWFAPSLPGMPVKFTKQLAGGGAVTTVTMIADSVLPR